MTRTFIGKRILESGPMSFREFTVALGVPRRQAENTLQQLIKTGVAERATRPDCTRYVYRLAA